MKYIIRNKAILGTILLGFIAVMWCSQITAAPSFKFMSFPFNKKTIAIQNYSHTAPAGIDPKVWRLAVTAYKNTRDAGIGTKNILTVVDYSLPSTARRLWVIDMSTKKVLFNTHVAHGKNSGDNYATKFSNRHGSYMSSIGMYLTGDIYKGNYGNSLNLFGLEEKYNSNAHARRIVFHKALYVGEHIVKQWGRLGRSFGCLALSPKLADKVMDYIKEGSLVFCYYPDQGWLQESKLLQAA